MFARATPQLWRTCSALAPAVASTFVFANQKPALAEEVGRLEEKKSRWGSSGYAKDAVSFKEDELSHYPLPDRLIREPRTGVQFPEYGSNGLKLAGCGVRLKFGVVPIYAVGLYSPDGLRIKENVLQELRDVETELRITLVRKLDAITFIKAIEHQLATRVVDSAQLDAFVDMCVVALPANMPSNTTTTIRLCRSGQVILTAAGKVPASILSPQVATALLDVYVGPDAVAPTARSAILNSLSRSAHM